MNVKSTPDDPISIRLGPALGLSQIPSLLDHLLHSLDTNHRLEFDLSEVSEIDIAGFQMVLILEKEASILGKEISFVRPSSAVRELFSLLGRLEVFEDRVLVAHR